MANSLWFAHFKPLPMEYGYKDYAGYEFMQGITSYSCG